MNCAYDGCMVTGEFKKGKYVYYRCTGHRGKCDLPRFREEELAQRLGEPLKGLQMPEEIVSRIVTAIRKDQQQSVSKTKTERSRLEARLATIHKHMDDAYTDKLNGKITEDFWERRSNDWRIEEQQVKMAIEGLESAETGDRALDAQRILELANKAYLLYVSEDSTEKAKLLKKLFWNCSVDAVSVMPTYRKPFDMIFERVKSGRWWARRDLNPQPRDYEFGRRVESRRLLTN